MHACNDSSTYPETSASLRRFQRLAAAVVAALGIVLPLGGRAQSSGISSPRNIIAGDPSAFVQLLATTRPPAISPERKALVMRSLPSNGEVEHLDTSAMAKLSALRPLLDATERESVYAIKVIDVPQAAIGIHGRAVVLISVRALRLLSVEELRATVAHEIGHEYVWAEHEGARLREDHQRLRQLELVCDAIAIATLHQLGMSTAALVSGLDKMIRFNRRHFGVSLKEKNYPPIGARRRFAREVEMWLGRAAPAQ